MSTAGEGIRVVLATRIFAPEPAAASFRLAALTRGLAAVGARVRVLTTSPPADMDAPADVPARVERWPVLRDAEGYVRGYVQYLSFDVPLVLRLLRTPRPDVVVCEPPPTTGAVVRVVSALRRVPYVYYAPDLWADAAESAGMSGFVVRALRAVEGWAMHGAARVIAVSAPVGARLAELGVERVEVVPNGVDTDVFTPDGPAVDAGGRPYLLYAGTASEWQGADIFIRALPRVLAEVPDARLVYLGQGSDWQGLRALADELPRGSVEFHPRAPADAAARWQRGAAACLASIVPGRGYDLAFPTKIHASLACGTPVLFAGVGAAVREIRQEGLGWAVDYDVDAVASAMLGALRAPRSPDETVRLSRWVRDHRSAAATGRMAATVVTAAAGTATT
ncbi:glycosyltransferase family 4 protein [Georgenia satyanarayanai]|uniref:glycosyltransferase family 4 protein n=1 Tax=Georgenia satyanarayanai TaxID=860221 RepID=UPI00203BF9C0|nr:glycosyltransferase family 4 protein [Georgenia satyanarayanai]MCM3661073.1 glycosyltransferase family 4 protein [Georgenia satyanarayanai]